MKDTFPEAFALVLKSEGGFVNHPADPGGMTNLGVTKAAWEAFLGKSVTEADMRALTPKTVMPFYQVRYWDACKCNDLPLGLDYAVYDFAVNSGPARAIKSLQQVAGVLVDGKIGPQTVSAVSAMPVADAIGQLCALRLSFLKRLDTWDVFGKGWGSRIADVERVANRLASV